MEDGENVSRSSESDVVNYLLIRIDRGLTILAAAGE